MHYNEWVASGTNFHSVLQCTVCPLGEKHFDHSYGAMQVAVHC